MVILIMCILQFLNSTFLFWHKQAQHYYLAIIATPGYLPAAPHDSNLQGERGYGS